VGTPNKGKGREIRKQAKPCFNLLGAFAEPDALQPTCRVTPGHEHHAAHNAFVKDGSDNLLMFNAIQRPHDGLTARIHVISQKFGDFLTGAG
jgi:hypothetical protein